MQFVHAALVKIHLLVQEVLIQENVMPTQQTCTNPSHIGQLLQVCCNYLKYWSYRLVIMNTQ